MILWSRLRRWDWILTACAILLTLLGLTMIYSIGVHSTPPDFFKFQKQIAFAGVGIASFVFFGLIDYRRFRGMSWVFYVGVLFLLVVVLFFGASVRGTRGWIEIFGQNILQPIEVSKPFFVFFLASVFANRLHRAHQIRTALLTLGLTLIPVTLGLLQPDFGSPFLYLCVWAGFMVVSKMGKRVLAGSAGIGLILIAAAWFLVFNDHQKERLMTFLQPTANPLEEGYHVQQSIIAVGSGEWRGRGLGLGPQSQLNFLPEQETDFIFAVIAEELGFLGSLVVLLLFSILYLRLIFIARAATDAFGSLLVVGLLILFAAQTFINIGMNIGIAPVTGIPLPLVSAGGSQLLSMFVALGWSESVALRRRLSIESI